MVAIEVSAEAGFLVITYSVVVVAGVAMVVWVSSKRVVAERRAMRRGELGGSAIGRGWLWEEGCRDVFLTFCVVFC